MLKCALLFDGGTRSKILCLKQQQMALIPVYFVNFYRISFTVLLCHFNFHGEALVKKHTLNSHQVENKAQKMREGNRATTG